MHALNSGLDIRSYARNSGRKENTVGNEVKAARVAAVTDIGDDLGQRFSRGQWAPRNFQAAGRAAGTCRHRSRARGCPHATGRSPAPSTVGVDTG
jgi:hypothetical protein